MVEKLESRSFQLKRAIIAHLIKTVWPVEFTEQTPGNLAAFDKRLRSGHGAIGLVPHFSKGDFLTILCSLVTKSEEFTRRPVLIPIAAHQRPTYLDWICNFTDINLTTIITLETRHKEKQLQERGKSIPWQGIDSEAAVNAYLDGATQTLNAGGIVILAPQAGRRNLLTPFKGTPITLLEQRIQRMGIDDLAFFAVGLEVPGAEDYSKLKDLNIRSKYRIILGKITKREEITSNIDRWAYESMLELAPFAYRPQKIQS